jgi:hypothetical protein
MHARHPRWWPVLTALIEAVLDLCQSHHIDLRNTAAQQLACCVHGNQGKGAILAAPWVHVILVLFQREQCRQT